MPYHMEVFCRQKNWGRIFWQNIWRVYLPRIVIHMVTLTVNMQMFLFPFIVRLLYYFAQIVLNTGKVIATSATQNVSMSWAAVNITTRKSSRRKIFEPNYASDFGSKSSVFGPHPYGYTYSEHANVLSRRHRLYDLHGTLYKQWKTFIQSFLYLHFILLACHELLWALPYEIQLEAKTFEPNSLSKNSAQSFLPPIEFHTVLLTVTM